MSDKPIGAPRDAYQTIYGGTLETEAQFEISDGGFTGGSGPSIHRYKTKHTADEQFEEGTNFQELVTGEWETDENGNKFRRTFHANPNDIITVVDQAFMQSSKEQQNAEEGSSLDSDSNGFIGDRGDYERTLEAFQTAQKKEPYDRTDAEKRMLDAGFSQTEIDEINSGRDLNGDRIIGDPTQFFAAIERGEDPYAYQRANDGYRNPTAALPLSEEQTQPVSRTQSPTASLPTREYSRQELASYAIGLLMEAGYTVVDREASPEGTIELTDPSLFDDPDHGAMIKSMDNTGFTITRPATTPLPQPVQTTEVRQPVETTVTTQVDEVPETTATATHVHSTPSHVQETPNVTINVIVDGSNPTSSFTPASNWFDPPVSHATPSWASTIGLEVPYNVCANCFFAGYQAARPAFQPVAAVPGHVISTVMWLLELIASSASTSRNNGPDDTSRNV